MYSEYIDNCNSSEVRGMVRGWILFCIQVSGFYLEILSRGRSSPYCVGGLIRACLGGSGGITPEVLGSLR